MTSSLWYQWKEKAKNSLTHVHICAKGELVKGNRPQKNSVTITGDVESVETGRIEGLRQRALGADVVADDGPRQFQETFQRARRVAAGHRQQERLHAVERNVLVPHLSMEMEIENSSLSKVIHSRSQINDLRVSSKK